MYIFLLGREEANTKYISEVNFVDLPGSEVLSYDFGAIQQQETKSINLSLFCLKAVISSLSKKAKFVPYRNSVLTKLLKNSLGGNSLTSIICTVSPSSEHVAMSLRTLEFG